MTSLHNTAAVLAAATLMVACSSAGSGTWDRSADELEIYTVVVDSLTAGTRGPVIVNSRTLPDYTRDKQVPEYWRDLYAIPGIDRGTVLDFQLTNGSQRTITALPASRAQLKLVTDSLFRAAPPAANATIALTRPGISPNHRQAMIEVIRRAPDRNAADAWTVLLSKDTGRWTILSLIPARSH